MRTIGRSKIKIFLSENVCLAEMNHFGHNLGPKMTYFNNSRSMLRILFEVLNNGRGENVQESFGSSYSEKILVQDKFPILGPLWASK